MCLTSGSGMYGGLIHPYVPSSNLINVVLNRVLKTLEFAESLTTQLSIFITISPERRYTVRYASKILSQDSAVSLIIFIGMTLLSSPIAVKFLRGGNQKFIFYFI